MVNELTLQTIEFLDSLEPIKTYFKDIVVKKWFFKEGEKVYQLSNHSGFLSDFLNTKQVVDDWYYKDMSSKFKTFIQKNDVENFIVNRKNSLTNTFTLYKQNTQLLLNIEKEIGIMSNLNTFECIWNITKAKITFSIYLNRFSENTKKNIKLTQKDKTKLVTYDNLMSFIKKNKTLIDFEELINKTQSMSLESSNQNTENKIKSEIRSGLINNKKEFMEIRNQYKNLFVPKSFLRFKDPFDKQLDINIFE